MGTSSWGGELIASNTATSPSSDRDDFLINVGATTVAFIETENGNMYIDGILSENQSTLTPSGADDNFIIKNGSGTVVGYLDNDGDLFLKGSLYEEASLP